MSSNTLAAITFKIVTNALLQENTRGRRAFRIKNLQSEEVQEFAQLWSQNETNENLNNISLIIAESLNGSIPQRYVAATGTSITWYRNNIDSGLVYIETKDQSDAQGLQNFFTLRDSNYLDGSFDDSCTPYTEVAQLVVAEAWLNITKKADCPALLIQRLPEIMRLMRSSGQSIPIRKFIKFVEGACAKWLANSGPKDDVTSNALIGEALWILDLFPDPLWRNDEIEGKTQRRLELNARYSDMRSTTGDIDPDALERIIVQKSFQNENGELFDEKENQHWRKSCIDFLREPTTETRKKIPYVIFEQLFTKDSLGLKLGERVYHEIFISEPNRIAELIELDVVDGLNHGHASDASILLEAVPIDEDKSSLVSLLTRRTRNALDKLINPPIRSFKNPLVELAKYLESLREQYEKSEPITKIRLDLSCDPESVGASLGLFAFIYGNTLKETASNSVESQFECTLEIDSRLVKSIETPTRQEIDLAGEAFDADADEDIASNQELDWGYFPLRITAFGEDEKVLEIIDNLQWQPDSIAHLAMFWLLVSDPESRIFSSLGSMKASEEMLTDRSNWLNPFIQKFCSLHNIIAAESRVIADSDYIVALLNARTEFRDSVTLNGLNCESINSYFDIWRVQIEIIRKELINQGNRIEVNEAILSADSIDFDGQFRIILPTHPLRLRWIGAYLSESKKVLTSVLDNNAKFVARNGETYLNWLVERGPTELPPATISRDTSILLSRSETSWFGEYAPIQKSSVSLEDDPIANAQLCAKIVAYINAHPYKRDGLSILLLNPYTDTLASDIVGRLSRSSHKNGGKLIITIAAATKRWESIARAVENAQLDVEARTKSELFPPFDLTFIDFVGGDHIDDLLEDKKFDIGIVTHLLNGTLQLQQVTDIQSSLRGHFDALLDEGSKLATSETSGETSIILKPERPDSALESWSTLLVRAARRSPVSPSQPENTDYIQLRQDFDSSAKSFNSLHRSCHWVLTLERHISRKQIESLDAGSPDVLSITEGVGRNELNTLVVSSRAGRELIESRLARKLRKLVNIEGDPADFDISSRRIARAVYDETRRLAPHLALSAMGISRVTEEILGVSLARRIAQQIYPIPKRVGIAAWISLDEYADWFGGHSAIRADMCRLVLCLGEKGAVEVEYLVVEGKLRQTFDPYGIDQAKITSQHFRDILNTTENEDSRVKVDSKFWRNKIIAAIESSADEAIERFGDTNLEDSDSKWLQIREAFRDGHFELMSGSAIYSVTLWESSERLPIIQEQDGVKVIRTAKNHILPILEGRFTIADETPQAQRFAPTSTEGGLETYVSTKSSSLSALEGFSPPNALKPQNSSIAQSINARMSGDELMRIYDEILACYASFGVSVTSAPSDEAPIIEGPASILFKVRPTTGVDPKKVYEKAEALKLRLRLARDQVVGFDNDRGYVTIDVPKSEEQRYFIEAERLWANWSRPDLSLATPIGEDRFGETVEIDFSSSNSPHLLIGGTTGSGKSEALNTILFGLAKHYSSEELQFLLVDPKGTELKDFEKSAHLRGAIGIFDDDAIEILKDAVDEMERRYHAFRGARVRSISDFNKQSAKESRLPWWVIVLDEYADLTSDNRKKKEIEEQLKRLAQKARACGIHVIIATQKPSAEVISTNLRSNLPAQIALRVKSGIESRVIMDDLGAETLNGKGDAFIKAEGKLRRVQCARVNNPEFVLLAPD